jgi:hypothetical protein
VWFKHRAWIVVAWLVSLVNVVAVWYAVQPGEPPWHATGHALLALLFGLGAQRLWFRDKPSAAASVMTRQELEGRLGGEANQVARAVDAIAVEVERIGEGQRFLTKLLTEREARLPDMIRSPAEPTD